MDSRASLISFALFRVVTVREIDVFPLVGVNSRMINIMYMRFQEKLVIQCPTARVVFESDPLK